MTKQAVAVGDDGRSPVEDPNAGPVLTAFREFTERFRQDYRRDLEQYRLKVRQHALAMQPAYAPVTSSGIIGTDGNLVINLGGPQIGRRWVVRMITISDAGAFWNTMSSAQAVIATGSSTAGDTVLPNMVRWPFSSLPNSANFGSDQMWINPRDKLLVAITGGTSTQNVQVTAWLQDFAVESVPLSTEEV